MPIVITCPDCKSRARFSERLSGKWESCPGCGRSLFLSPDLREEAVPKALPAGEPEPPEVIPVRRPRGDFFRNPEEERGRGGRGAEGRPTYEKVPHVYYHPDCGGSTRISDDIVRMLVSDPFRPITSTLCAGCRRYVSLHAVEWPETGETVAQFRFRLRWEMHPLLIAVRLFLGPLAITLFGAVLGALFNPRHPVTGAFIGGLIGLLLGYFVVGFFFQFFRDPRRVVR
jgi:hypothetical protein